ncbi:MAG: LacI family DNA-binding transcriptional regulator [Streptosporangiaceae bacterium]
MATIADVARYAGVSRSTVSHALSGKRTISRATRERVNEAVRALNYRANAGARALATARTMILALAVPFTPEEFAPATLQYVLAITQTARGLGYDVLLVTQEEGADGIARVTESNLVDGVIVLDVKRRDPRASILSNIRQPGVLIGMPDDEPAVDCVDLDFAAAGTLLIDHLAERGHRDVMFLTLPDELFAQDLGYAWRFRRAAIEQAERRGVALSMVPGLVDPSERAEALGAALDEHPTAAALLVHNDAALADLPHLLRQRHIEIPRDLSVVSIFPEQFGKMFALPYTAVDTGSAAVAARGVELLVSRLAEPERPVVREFIDLVLVDRGSVGTVA